MKLSNGHTFIENSALLDCDSEITLLRKEVAQRLKLNVKQKKLSVTSVLSKSLNIGSATASFDISSTSLSGHTQIFTWVVHNLKLPFNRYDISKIKKIHLHLKSIDFSVLKVWMLHYYCALIKQPCCSTRISVKNKVENQQKQKQH